RGFALPSDGTIHRSDDCLVSSYAGSFTEKTTHLPSGLGAGAPTCFIRKTSAWVMGALAWAAWLHTTAAAASIRERNMRILYPPPPFTESAGRSTRTARRWNGVYSGGVPICVDTCSEGILHENRDPMKQRDKEELFDPEKMQARVDRLKAEGKLPSFEELLAVAEEGARQQHQEMRTARTKSRRLTSIASHPEARLKVESTLPPGKLRAGLRKFVGGPAVIPIRKAD